MIKKIKHNNVDIVIASIGKVKFLTPNGENQLLDIAVRGNVVCPTFKSKTGRLLYGGSLEVIEKRERGVVVLEPKWNQEMPLEGKIECVMGACAFRADKCRILLPELGTNICNLIDLVGLSLKARISGIPCCVSKDVVASLDDNIPTQPPSDLAYCKMRLSFVIFPPEIATMMPTLLTGTPGLQEAMMRFASTCRDIYAEQQSFWETIAKEPKQALQKANIKFSFERESI